MLPARVALALQGDGWWIRSHIAWVKDGQAGERQRSTDAAVGADLPADEKRGLFLGSNRGRRAFRLRRSQAFQFPPEQCRDCQGRAQTFSAKNAESMRSYAPTRNMTNVWRINPKPFMGAHFATFPPALPRKAIQAATSDAGCCPSCRSPYGRLIEKGVPDLEHQLACGSDITGEYEGQATKDFAAAGVQNASDVKRRVLAGMVSEDHDRVGTDLRLPAGRSRAVPGAGPVRR